MNEDEVLKKLAKLPTDIADSIKKKISDQSAKILHDEIKSYKNKQRIVSNDAKKEHVSAKDVLSPEQINSLPAWVKDDLDNAVIIGKSKQVVQVSSGRKYHLKNKLNHLSGAEWTYYINSIINTRYPAGGDESYAHSIRKIHPSPKPPQLMRSIIEFFTKEGDQVFDYFSGVGGTLLGASLAGRSALGIDLDEKYHEAYRSASQELGLVQQATIAGDSMDILSKGDKVSDYLKGEKFSLILIDPPYGDMLSRERTGELAKNGSRAATPFTNSDKDLGNTTWADFRRLFKQSLEDALQHLKKNGHIVIFIKDLQPDGDELNLLHADLIKDVHSIDGVQYLGTKIWADQSVNLYPYGYPYSYVSNQIHQYIMTFKYKGL